MELWVNLPFHRYNQDQPNISTKLAIRFFLDIGPSNADHVLEGHITSTEGRLSGGYHL
jgi:hypothetical protein